jgi:hypothetical protein
MPRRYTPEEREAAFWAKVEKGPECWIWTASKNGGGYGLCAVEGRRIMLAHRRAYEQKYGSIPKGMVTDHLCRNPACVNPDHLEIVTDRVNILRGNGLSAQRAKQTHCKHGHPLTPDNIYKVRTNERKCKECGRARDKARYERSKQCQK